MSRRAARPKLLPDTPGHDGGLPPRSAKEATQRLFGKGSALKDLAFLQQLHYGEEHSEPEMGSLDGVPRLLDDSQATSTEY